MSQQYDYGSNLIPFPNIGLWSPGASQSLQTNQTLDVAAEGVQYLGYLCIDGRATGKTISSAGGKIHFMVGASTFAAAAGGSVIRVGLQDVSATAGTPARGDGTFDVYKDLTSATDTITANAYNTATMATGTKTLSHGDLVAISFKMTARGGADSVVLQSMAMGALNNWPQVTAESSTAVFTGVQNAPNAIIEFDDGTFGWIQGTFPVNSSVLNLTYDVNNVTADEYGCPLRFPRPVTIDGLWVFAQFVGSGPHEVLLYSDPFGTPTLVPGTSISYDSDMIQAASNRLSHFMFAAPVTLNADTTYIVTIRPTTADDVVGNYFTVSNASFLKAMSGGTYATYAQRLNNTGAFTETTTRRFLAGVLLAGGNDLHVPRASYQLGA